MGKQARWVGFDSWAAPFEDPDVDRVDNGAGREIVARPPAYDGVVPAEDAALANEVMRRRGNGLAGPRPPRPRRPR